MKYQNIENTLKNIKNKVKSGDVYYSDPQIKKLFNILIKESLKIFPDKTPKLIEIKTKVMTRNHGPYGSDILNSCKLIRKYLDIQITKDSKTDKSFLDPSDLIRKAGSALRQEQEAYCIHLCDSAIESFLKEYFNVPKTITGVGTVKFLSECLILEIPPGMQLYLKEVKNKVCQMDNQIKHKAYIPSRLDAINSLKATEELYLRKSKFQNLTEEEIKKIHFGIGLIK